MFPKDDMQWRAMLATFLILVIFLVYSYFTGPSVPPTETPPKPEAPAARPVEPGPPKPAVAPPREKSAAGPSYTPTARAAPPPRTITVETPLLRVVFSTRGAVATHWELKRYTMDGGKPVDLVADASAPGALGLILPGLPADAVYESESTGVVLKGAGEQGKVTFRHVTEAGLKVEKTLAFRADDYLTEVDLRLTNVGGETVTLQAELTWGPGFLRPAEDGKKLPPAQPPTLWINDGRVHENVEKLEAPAIHRGALSWVALQDTYFAAALVPREKETVAVVAKGPEGMPVVALQAPKVTLGPGASSGSRFAAYIGPKELDRLTAGGSDLDNLVDLGYFMFGSARWMDLFLARPALVLLRFLRGLLGNYGLAIIVITILQKIVFHPLTVKSMRSMQAMSALQPALESLRERHKNNKQKLQQETMELYRRHGVNPMGGCLPMLIQVPIFIALYNALANSIELWRARFLWVSDLSQPEHGLFTLWGGTEVRILPLLMGASMYLQQKMSPTAGDPRQAQMMLYLMPTLFTFMFWGFPSGLVLYWLVNNLLQIGQQYLILRPQAAPKAA